MLGRAPDTGGAGLKLMDELDEVDDLEADDIFADLGGA